MKNLCKYVLHWSINEKKDINMYWFKNAQKLISICLKFDNIPPLAYFYTNISGYKVVWITSTSYFIMKTCLALLACLMAVLTYHWVNRHSSNWNWLHHEMFETTSSIEIENRILGTILAKLTCLSCLDWVHMLNVTHKYIWPRTWKLPTGFSRYQVASAH